MVAIRFETLIEPSLELTERRRRMMSSALAAAVLSMAAGTTVWIGDRLGVSAVAPPSSRYEVTLSMFEAPPPPEPPRIPEAAAAATTKAADPSPDPEPRSEPDDPPLEEPPLDLDRPPRGSSGVPGDGDGTGTHGGPHIGVPGPQNIGTCVLPPCATTPIPTHRPPTPPKAAPAPVPIDTMMATAIFSPDPDRKRLAQTPTGRSHRQSGRSSVSFCVDRSGETFDVRTRRAFRGDPEVDQICRQTVSRWRFTPMRVGGKVRTTCTTVTFEIQFD